MFENVAGLEIYPLINMSLESFNALQRFGIFVFKKFKNGICASIFFSLSLAGLEHLINCIKNIEQHIRGITE